MVKPDPDAFFRTDPTFDAVETEAGRLLFAGECTFVLGAASLEQLPATDRPEVCFAGRSNVGKSSLINALTGRKALARSSNTPGRTQQLNYFDLAGRFYLVDLPGYGYAAAPVDVVRQWQELLKQYLRGRANLRRAFVLVDSRHGLKKVDHEIMELLDMAAVNFQAVLTKTDKPKGAALGTTLEALRQGLLRHPAAHPDILTTSTEKGHGISALRAQIHHVLTS